jgi:LysM repeat protein
MPDQTSSPRRLLAPIALAVCAIAFFSVLLSSGSGDGGAGNERAPTKKQSAGGKQRTSPQRANKATYTVRSGDTLGAIAARVGLTVEKLQELNPQLDPQALVAGQKIKLRE